VDLVALQNAINFLSSCCYAAFLTAAIYGSLGLMYWITSLSWEDVPFAHVLQAARVHIYPQLMTILGFNMLGHIAMLSFLIDYSGYDYDVSTHLNWSEQRSQALVFSPAWCALGYLAFLFSFFVYWIVGGICFARASRSPAAWMSLCAYHMPNWVRVWATFFYGGGDITAQAAITSREVRKSLAKHAPDIDALVKRVELEEGGGARG